jgi:serine/threonine-protein kinase HipA
MAELQLDVRIDGFSEPVGALVRDANGALAFAYAPTYIRNQNAIPLSLSLPLSEQPFADVSTRSFFDNLLQERDGLRRKIMASHGLQRDDVAGLLFHIGKDCPGALSVLPAGSPPAKTPGDYEADYVPISENSLKEIVRALHNQQRLPDGTSDPSPLAGVQSKIALTRLPDGRLAEPRPGSGAPTTHILKAPDRTRPQDARLEAKALDLSRELRFETAAAEIVNAGGIEALLVKRFDRDHDDQGRVIRIHQEDFAQALGLPPELKYERRGQPGRCFDVAGIRWVLNQTNNPALERLRFVREVLFDIAIGNADAHAKNRALLHKGPANITVAPRYDLLPTALDPDLTDEFPFSIGMAKSMEQLRAPEFDRFLSALGIESAPARRRIRIENANFVATSLVRCFPTLDDNDMRIFADMIAQNLRAFLPGLDVAVPAGAKERDLFLKGTGGWSLGS